jgi:cell division protein ZapA
MTDNLISINVWLAGRSYRIRIKPEEEAMVRKAVKLADDKISEMRTHYAGKDIQDFLAMTLITYATDEVTEGKPSYNLFEKELNKMVSKIDKALNK